MPLTANTLPLAVYIHWPYCVSKCPYCDFNSHVATSLDHEAFRTAYQKEIQHYGDILPGRTVHSVFFGGGTPSLMEPRTVAVILETLGNTWCFDKNIEITLEANPSSSEAGKFRDFRSAGVNRVSLGIQSLRDDALQFLGRAHNATEARKALALAAELFSRFSFDLIYARKEQTVPDWQEELEEALALAGSHLSLYQLTLEPTTQFYTRAGRGEILTATNDTAAHMFEMTQDIMRSRGLPAYEISNHARPGEESRHNLTYWHYEDYIGLGPGAHGRYRLNNTRIATDNHRSPEVWMKYAQAVGHGCKNSENLTQHMAMQEALMMGLRLTEGISLQNWFDKFGIPLLLLEQNDQKKIPSLASSSPKGVGGFLASEKIIRLKNEGYVRTSENTLSATPSGLQRLNAVIDYLLNGL